jgi:predicted ATPase with chaperone activity
VRRVAWTLADLAGRDEPTAAEVNEACEFRLGRAA